jgi:hypothetical protein
VSTGNLPKDDKFMEREITWETKLVRLKGTGLPSGRVYKHPFYSRDFFF